MASYLIYKHPDGSVDCVREGFTVFGLVFCGFWLLYKRAHLVGGAIVFTSVLLHTMFYRPEGYVFGVPYGYKFGLADFADLVFAVVVGFNGHVWHRESLSRRGYDFCARVEARTKDEARAVYLRGDSKTSTRIDPMI